jgi:hypothetical protein
MLKGKQVPNLFWGEAVITAAFILNRSFTRRVDGMTPYEAWHGRKPDVRFLRVFGCLGHVKVTGAHQQKLNDRSAPMVFIGYAEGSKAYKMYDPSLKRVHVSRDVIFDEEARWNWESPGEPPASSSFTVEYSVYVMRSAAGKQAGNSVAAESCRDTPYSTAAPAVTPLPARAREATLGGSASTPASVRLATPPTP